MPKIIDRTGEKHGRLLVLGLSGIRGKDRLCHVRCDCGVEKEVVQSKLTTKTKPIRSCGCLAKDNHHKTHELTSHRFYHIWKSMTSRCYKESSSSYKDYGGRGITICEEWKDTPLHFLAWLEENNYKKGLEIDRRNNNKGYSPENCRITTKSVNCRNKRDTVMIEWNGRTIPLIELAEMHNIKYGTMYRRINKMKLSPEDAVNFKRKQKVK